MDALKLTGLSNTITNVSPSSDTNEADWIGEGGAGAGVLGTDLASGSFSPDFGFGDMLNGSAGSPSIVWARISWMCAINNRHLSKALACDGFILVASGLSWGLEVRRLGWFEWRRKIKIQWQHELADEGLTLEQSLATVGSFPRLAWLYTLGLIFENNTRQTLQ